MLTILCLTFFAQMSLVFSKNVIIIGAGPSGVAAASRLLKNNFTNFQILEAESRIGGRIDTRKIGDSFVDFGAEYVHGQYGNAVYEMVKNLNVLDDGLDINKTEMFYSDGGKVDDDLKLAVFDFNMNFQENVPDRSISVKELFLRNYNQSVVEKFKNEPRKKEIALSCVKLSQSMSQSLEGAFDWNKVAVNDNFLDYEGKQNVIWKGIGYKTILDVLLDNYPKMKNPNVLANHLVLDTKVKKIEWDSGEKVKIECGGSNYSADYVIFTPSIGVLKAHHKTMFVPALPAKKAHVIDAIGFDAIQKILLQFEEPLCDANDFIFAWNQDDLDGLDKFLYETGNEKKPWISEIYCLVKPYSNDNIWTAWVTGEAIPHIEKLSNEELKDGVMYTLRKFLGKRCNITENTEPVSVIQTKWYTNPNFLGSYSYETVELQKENLPFRQILEESLDVKGKPRVFFGGEATHPIRFATVDGAIMAGFREADKVLSVVS